MQIASTKVGNKQQLTLSNMHGNE